VNLYSVKKVISICSLLICISFSVLSQSETEKEKLRQLEIQRQAEKQRLITMQLDSAIMLLDAGEYSAANDKFLYILKNVKSVPSDLTFYFGKNSFFLGKYKQSIDWLNKYIQLKGTSGQFSQEAVMWKLKSENELLKEKEQEAKQAATVLSNDYDIDCGPSGKVICPVCNGTTVIIKKGYISNTYKTCGYCNHTGKLLCEDYNKLLRGELKPAN
jgi:tetratricopeptide (TPR) repeat protein